ncbi:MAG TPA: hypothetical protein VGV09_01225 [Steroidobacteraceae bacterium]|nr:hypothetical protein [Steroidobacteraceae bacterium]
MLRNTVRHHLLSILVPMALSLCTTTFVCAAVAPAPNPSPADSSPPLQEVTVVGRMDTPKLNHEIQQFVKSHAKPGAHIGQVGRWRENVCPTVSGLQGPVDDLVSHRITDVARAVGAPTRAAGKTCDVNVEVVFTPSPQGLVDRIAKVYRPMLGYFPTAERQQALTFSRPVQAWYVTGTRSLDYQPPIDSAAAASPSAGNFAGAVTDMYAPGLHLDSYDSADSKAGFAPSGIAGSRISKGLRSEFVHVLVIVDSKAVAKLPVQSISDYIAMLALTRLASADVCSELPSIVNLLATGCSAAPTTITSADIAYLKGLYGANLEQNLNVEQADMHEVMRREMLRP